MGFHTLIACKPFRRVGGDVIRDSMLTLAVRGLVFWHDQRAACQPRAHVRGGSQLALRQMAHELLGRENARVGARCALRGACVAAVYSVHIYCRVCVVYILFRLYAIKYECLWFYTLYADTCCLVYTILITPLVLYNVHRHSIVYIEDICAPAINTYARNGITPRRCQN